MALARARHAHRRRDDADDAARAAGRRRRHRQLAARRRAAPRASIIPNIAAVARVRRPRALAVRRRRSPCRHHARRMARRSIRSRRVDEAAGWIAGVLRGLAFGHDAGVAHLDLQLHSILINERGQASVMALGGRARARPTAAPRRRRATATAAPRAPSRRAARPARRRRARRARLRRRCCTACSPARRRSAAPTSARVIERMAPRGRELVRLPWTTPQPIAGSAARDRQPQHLGPGAPALSQRAHLPRRAHRLARGGRRRRRRPGRAPARSAAHASATCRRCPAWPSRVQRITAIESQRTDEIARHLLPDMALSFELLQHAQLGARAGHADRRQRRRC